MWNVIYRKKDSKILDFEIFSCNAFDMEDAEDKTSEQNPECEILWADQEKDPQKTVQNWFDS